MTDQERLQKMHRRAQKAEGELARIKKACQDAVRHGLWHAENNKVSKYHMLGYMLAHMKPTCHLLQTPSPQTRTVGTKEKSHE